MKNHTTSILEEISTFSSPKNRESFVENKALHIIASARHLVEYIESNYQKEDADDLLKRLFNSIRSGDESKFRRGIKMIKESKNESKY